MTKTNRVNEEKLLNEVFVVLEYSDSFAEFINNISGEARQAIHKAVHDYYRFPEPTTGE